MALHSFSSPLLSTVVVSMRSHGSSQLLQSFSSPLLSAMVVSMRSRKRWHERIVCIYIGYYSGNSGFQDIRRVVRTLIIYPLNKAANVIVEVVKVLWFRCSHVWCDHRCSAHLCKQVQSPAKDSRPSIAYMVYPGFYKYFLQFSTVKRTGVAWLIFTTHYP